MTKAILSVALALALTALSSPAFAAQEGAAPSGEFRDCADCPSVVRLPGGSFDMGDEGAGSNPDQRPVHRVTLPAFAVGRYEVTVGEFAAFVADTAREIPTWCHTDRNRTGRWRTDSISSWRDPGFPQTDRHPVVCVTWADAVAYAEWLSRRTGKAYRLLSEAEWEYAIRAGSTSQYWWGDDANDLCAYANGPDQTVKQVFPGWTTASCTDGQAFAAPVGSYRANGFGLNDMAGNVWEWTQDCYAAPYGAQPRDGSAHDASGCVRRVLRGGSWVYGLGDLRSALRNPLPEPTIRGGDIGFRVARTL